MVILSFIKKWNYKKEPLGNHHNSQKGGWMIHQDSCSMGGCVGQPRVQFVPQKLVFVDMMVELPGVKLDGRVSLQMLC